MKKITYKQLKQDTEKIAEFIQNKVDKARPAVKKIKNNYSDSEVSTFVTKQIKTGATAIKIISTHTHNKYLEFKAANKKK